MQSSVGGFISVTVSLSHWVTTSRLQTFLDLAGDPRLSSDVHPE